MGIQYVNTLPADMDSVVVLLGKMLQAIGGTALAGDTPQTLLSRILSLISGASGGSSLYVVKGGDTMTGSLNIGNISGTDSFDYQFFTTGGAHFRRKTANANPAVIDFDKQGTTGDKTAAVDFGNNVGQILWNGWDGAAFGELATIIGLATETFNAGAHGGRLSFSTTTAATTTRTERVRIETGLDLRNGSQLQIAGAEYFQTQSYIASGAVFTIPNNALQVITFNGGGNPIEVDLSQTGKYLIRGRVMVSFVAATFAASRTLLLKIRNPNSGSYLTDTITTLTIPVMTTVTQSIPVNLPETLYTASSSGDYFQIWCQLSTLPTAGSVQITEGSMTVMRVGA